MPATRVSYKSTQPKPRQKMTTGKQKNTIRQYGDKGYKPSNGKGVGY
jgi:hypothetical protein